MSHTPVNRSLVPGWFGKIPNLGDFASRRLPDEFIDAWDRWLQLGMAQARDEVGEVWRAVYLVAPIHRFWIGPGTLGAEAWRGLIMPSVDRVGRFFPLTLAAPAGALAEALATTAWFEALDGVARRTLDAEFTADDLEAELLAVSRLGDEALADAANTRLADAVLRRGAAGRACSVWWRDEPRDEAGLHSFPGLPPANAFGPLLAVSA